MQPNVHDALFKSTFEEELKEAIVTAADQLREQGREQGRKQGQEQGRREMLLRLLQVKFGELPEEVVARVTAADMKRLWVWAERVLTATTLDEALAG